MKQFPVRLAVALFACVTAVAHGGETSNDVFKGLFYASASAEPVRLDTRTSFGGRLARGVEKRGTPDGSETVEWNTVQEGNGWHTLTDGGQSVEVAVQNDPLIAIEGGRLAENTLWSNDVVHVVRNWVTVPSGVTLAIKQETIVKFTENSGIWVEEGGVLDLTMCPDAVFTQTMDDSVGGNTDLRALANRRQNVQIHVQPGGEVRDLGQAEMRYVHVDTFGTIVVEVAQCLEQEGRVFARFRLDGEMPEKCTCDYVTADGSAVSDSDYATTSGSLMWTSLSEGDKWVEIPILKDSTREEDETFSLNITAVRGMNVSTDEAKIKIVDGNVRIKGAVMSSYAAASVRVDMRSGTGGRLAHGTERIGRADGSAAEEWNTTGETDGWKRIERDGTSVDLLVRNGADVEEGRLAEDAVWSNDVVHVVRHWVTVPDGKTLTILPGTEVKFTEDAGIRVEDGGVLVANGEATNRVVFTVMADDATRGGDTDMKTDQAGRNGARIYAQSELATVTENGYLENRYLDVNCYGGVSAGDVKLLEQTGCAYVPVTLSTSRTGLFEVDWVAVDETAKLGEDYSLASGTLSWTGSSEGTKFIEIPVVEDVVDDGGETFRVKLVAARGVNLSREAAVVTIEDSAVKLRSDCMAMCAAQPVRVDMRTSFGGRLAHGTENVGMTEGDDVRVWDTTAEADGLVTLEDGTNRCEIAVLNDEGLAVEEGRLAADTVWSNDLLHVVRNWVSVPSGVTLTVTAGAVVKFTEDTGIRVEDGGRLEVVGEADRRVVFTHAEDDSIGGDTDFAEREADWQDVQIYAQSDAATVSENGYLETRFMNVSGYGRVSIEDAKAIEVVGMTYIPVSVSGTRSGAFSLDWAAIDGTATLSNDYSLATGTLSWTGTGEGTKFIQIPLVMDSVYESNETFRVRIVAVRGMNVERETGTVSLVDSEAVVKGEDIAFCTAAPARLDMRTSFGGRLAHGTETVGSVTGDVTVVWNTAEEPDGWKTLQDGSNSVEVATVNDAGISIEGGRLKSDTLWNDDVVRVVRNWVTVPDGVTLKVTAGAVVKFTENAGIRVEDGGILEVEGAAAKHVVFAPVDDDTIGGDTDMKEGVASWCNAQIYKMPSGTVTENSYLEVRKAKVSSWAGVSLGTAQAAESNGRAYVPVTLKGSRSAAFSVDWEAVAGTAAFGEDFTVASGTLSWTGTSEGTKFIEVPLVSDSVPEAVETFTLKLRGACGMNVEGESAEVGIVDSEVSLPCAPMSVAAAPVRLDMRTSFGGRLAHGVEALGSVDGSTTVQWDTRTVSDGWIAKSDGDETVDLAVINSASVAVEGGRLQGPTVWDAGKVHLVRNWVVVPNGVTLTVRKGAVVKFTENTGIKIEDGGVLDTDGTLDERVVFTVAEDDASGGDIDMRNLVAENQNVQIYAMPNGTFSENGGLETRFMTANSWGSVSVQAAQTHEGTGKVYIPVTVSGTRTKPFSIYWKALDGTACLGEDYTVASGRIDWTGVSEGTKFIEIPVVRNEIAEGVENFTVLLTGGSGMNLSAASANVGIFDTDRFAKTLGEGTAAIDVRTNLVTKLVCGTVGLPYSGSWQTNLTETAQVRIKAERVDGMDEKELLAVSAPTNGVLAWDTTLLSDGWWRLTHEEIDADGNLLDAHSAQLNVRQDVVVHDAILADDEVWEGDGITHYLSEDFWIAEGKSLTIEPGAIIKGEIGTLFSIETDAVLTAQGMKENPIVFTSVRDDAHGGDLDGDGGMPSANDWEGLKIFAGGAENQRYASWLYCTSAGIDANGKAHPLPDDAFWAAYPELLESAGGDKEAAAYLVSPGTAGKGKFDRNGKPVYVWSDFVAGTSPNDDNDLLRAIISIEEGKPVITWEPALNDTDVAKGVKKGVRTYKVFGTTELGGIGNWKEVASGKESDYRFFKVTVGMP